MSSTSVDESKKALGAKVKTNALSIIKFTKENTRQNAAFKTKDRQAKQSARKDPVFKTKETESKLSARKNHVFKRKERESKQLS